jgi:hypothetical protein
VRKSSNTYYAQRFIRNQDEIVERLFQVYGRDNVVIFDHRQYNLNDTIRLFASAKAIIGPHGGGLYNQFFAHESCVIVEIMPVKATGLYPDQDNAEDVPTFSHMAVWSNSVLIGQKFWRFYSVTNSSVFDVNIDAFFHFLAQIPELRK